MAQKTMRHGHHMPEMKHNHNKTNHHDHTMEHMAMDDRADNSKKMMDHDDMKHMSMSGHAHMNQHTSMEHADMGSMAGMAGHNHMHMGGVGLWQKRLIMSIILSIPMTYFMLIDFFGMSVPFAHLLHPYMAVISFVAATIAILYLGASFWRSTVAGLRDRMFNMDSLITIGTTTAYVYSWLAYLMHIIENHSLLLPNSGTMPHLYFETVVFLFTFVILGKWLEARANQRTNQSIRNLVKLRPRQAHLVNGNNTVSIPTEKIKLGDHLMVLPGESIPADGVVCDGTSNVNESMITGESVAIDKTNGSKVLAGTINGHGSLEIVVQKVGEDTMLSRIIRLIREAQTSRAPIETTADRIANVFVPMVIGIALVTFAVWYFYGGATLPTATMMFVSVVMIACPCAFGLATPTAVTVGIGMGSSNGILIKNGDSLQKLSQIDTVVFDKTGTLTIGKPVVTDVVALEDDAKQIMTIASSLERRSEHSLARAIIGKANKQHLETLPVSNFTALPGKGIRGVINEKTYYLGSIKLVTSQLPKIKLPDISDLEKAGKSVCYLIDNKKILGIIAITDQPKLSAAKTIKELHSNKIETYLLSGDNQIAAKTVAKKLGIKHVISDVAPDKKADFIKNLQHKGKSVAMVGDGINDAPAIATADVGVAIGTGTDVAIESGNIVLVSGDPYGLCQAIRLSRSTVNKIRQNLFFSLFYNVVSIPIAAGVFIGAGLTLQPELAGLIMALSSVAVIINSLTLRLVDVNKRDPISFLAPAILLMLFSILYLEFILPK